MSVTTSPPPHPAPTAPHLHLPEYALRPKIYFGTVMLRGAFWLVDCEPQVLSRLKRVFGRVDKSDHDTIRIRRSPEVDRDLQWFLDRYPMELTDADQATLHAGAEGHRRTARDVLRVISGEIQPRSFKMELTPREYQRVAAEMWLRCRRLLLADDLGLGKTISAITALSDPALRPAAIVCETNLPHQWRAEILRCLPGASVHLIKGTQPYDVAARTAKENRLFSKGWPDFVILNYHRLDGWASTIAPRIKSVVFDEVQNLRHHETSRYAAAQKLCSDVEYALGMSATPIYNYGGEVFNVLDCLRPGVVGTREEFYREWCVGGEEERKKRIVDPRSFGLHLRESGVMLRRTRKEVGRELPALTIVPHHIRGDLKMLDTVKTTATELARTILSQQLGSGAGLAKMRAGGDFDRLLRQLTGVAKAPFVADFVRMVVESGERVLLAGWHREYWSIILERLKDLAPALYSGTESEKQKREALARFISGETPVLCLSIRSGAGIDGLQKVCRTAVVGELDWSPQVHAQFIGRLHRDGQTDPVTAYLLMSDEGSDPTVADVCGAKKANAQPITNPDAEVIDRQVDPDHIRKLAENFLARLK